jgi:hypothetical protein
MLCLMCLIPILMLPIQSAIRLCSVWCVSYQFLCCQYNQPLGYALFDVFDTNSYAANTVSHWAMLCLMCLIPILMLPILSAIRICTIWCVWYQFLCCQYSQPLGYALFDVFDTNSYAANTVSHWAMLCLMCLIPILMLPIQSAIRLCTIWCVWHQFLCCQYNQPLGYALFDVFDTNSYAANTGSH